MHPFGDGVVVRALRPRAERVVARIDGAELPLEHLHAGVWQALVPAARSPTTGSRSPTTARRTPADDPYRYLPTLARSTCT
jgi:1,4-alpha-glucan branching enzyme